MLYRKATKAELRWSPRCKAYEWKMSWWHWIIPVWVYSKLQARYADFDEMISWLEPGDSYYSWVMHGGMTFDGTSGQIEGLSPLFDQGVDKPTDS